MTLEYGLPLVAAGLALAFFIHMHFAGKRLDRMNEQFAQAEQDRAEAKKAALEAALKQPDISGQIAHASRTASVASGSYIPRGRTLASKRAASYRQHA